MAVPLLSRTGVPLGMLNAHWRQAKRRLKESELRFLDLLARQAADLIEQRRSQSALRENEARLRDRETDLARVQRIGGVGGLNIDVVNGLWSRRSPEYLRLHGLPLDRQDETHADWRARVHPDDVEDAERQLFSTLEGDALVYSGEYRIVRPSDGEVRWIAARADIERDVDGKALRMVGAHIDITEQKQVQEALHEREERLRNFGEASQDVLWVRDADTLDWTYLTPAFETVYGLSREEALKGDNFRNWLELIVPEDREHARGMIDGVVDGELITFEYRIRRPRDGEIRWIRDTDFPMRDERGRVVSIGGIGQDITSIKEAEERLSTSEERLRSAAEVAKFALWDWNMQTGQVAWSDEHYRMEGYEVGEITPSYQAWADRVHPDDLAETEAAIVQARDTKTEYVREFRSLYPDGSVHWHSARGRFFYDEGGTPIRMIGAMLDTTQRRDSEERQKVLVAELQHRTRNLITVVRAVSQQTQREVTSLEEFRDRFGDRMSALSRVQGMLSHLSAGARVTFNELLASELAALGAPDHKVTLDGPTDVPLRSATVQTFSLALHELATNALKYGALASAEGHLTVRWEALVASDGTPRLRVDWREAGVDMTHVGDQPRGGGYGRELIERALPYQLNAKTSYEMTFDGVHCIIDVPTSSTTA